MVDQLKPEPSRLGSLIKHYRQYSSSTQDELAAESGFDQSVINKIETGRQVPHDSTLEQIAIALAALINRKLDEAGQVDTFRIEPQLIYDRLIEVKRNKPAPVNDVHPRARLLSHRIEIFPKPIQVIVYDALDGLIEHLTKIYNVFRG